MTRMRQAKGRGIRIDSHTHLPLAERVVDVYTWVSDFEGEALMPDLRLHQVATEKEAKLERYHQAHAFATVPVIMPGG